MELSKLRKRSMKIQRMREKMKCESLGVIMPIDVITASKALEEMIDADACLHLGNQSEEQFSAETHVLLDFNEEIPSNDNRLYAFFLNKAHENRHCYRHSSDERRKICFLSDIITKIYQTTEQKQEKKKMKLNKMAKELQKLYIDIHELYVQLMESKSNTPRKEKENSINHQDKRIIWIKEVIEDKEKAYEELKYEEEVLQIEKINFLKLILKNGYHLSDGVMSIFSMLIKNSYKLEKQDLPDFLDNITKLCLLKQYETMIIESQNRKKLLPSIKSKSQSLSSSSMKVEPNLQSLSEHSKIKKIYKSTQEYIAFWIRKEKWKNNSLKHIAPGSSPKKSSWKEEEIKRLKRVHPKDKFEEVMKFIFGKPREHQILSTNRKYFLSTLKNIRKTSMAK